MKMPDLAAWAEHLKDPLVLVGFVMMILVVLVTTLMKKDKSQKMRRQSLLFAFIMGLVIIILGFGLAFMKENKKDLRLMEKTNSETAGSPSEEKTGVPNAPATSPTTVQQETHGNQSPAVVSGGDVNINFGK
jgi:hypothetical protein